MARNDQALTEKILDTIESPADLGRLSYDELERLAFEMRAEMIAATSLHGGHLAPSLGAVELIIALHRVLDCPRDRLVFDVGHQAYAHKLLTGRRRQFKTLRTYDGISPKAHMTPTIRATPPTRCQPRSATRSPATSTVPTRLSQPSSVTHRLPVAWRSRRSMT